MVLVDDSYVAAFTGHRPELKHSVLLGGALAEHQPTFGMTDPALT